MDGRDALRLFRPAASFRLISANLKAMFYGVTPSPELHSASTSSRLVFLTTPRLLLHAMFVRPSIFMPPAETYGCEATQTRREAQYWQQFATFGDRVAGAKLGASRFCSPPAEWLQLHETAAAKYKPRQRSQTYVDEMWLPRFMAIAQAALHVHRKPMMVFYSRVQVFGLTLAVV